MKLTHPDRPTPQYAFSERDIAYLISQGWTREELKERVEVADVPEKPKRGRPAKVKE